MPTSNAPSGHITLVFTDIEASSRMTAALGNMAYGEQTRQPQNARIQESLAGHNGHKVKTIGDSFMTAFQYVDDALACVCDIQRRLADPPIAATDRAARPGPARSASASTRRRRSCILIPPETTTPAT